MQHSAFVGKKIQSTSGVTSDGYQTLIKITKSGKKKPVQIVYNLMPSPVSLQVRPHFYNFKMGP